MANIAAGSVLAGRLTPSRAVPSIEPATVDARRVPMSEPARLQIHPAPASAVRTAVNLLSEWIGVEHLRLGGGTALEARWHHRTSTDLDFFALGRHADTVFYECLDDMKADLTRFALDGVISEQGIRLTGRTIVHFRIGDTPVSFGRVDLFHGDPRDEVEYDTGVILSATRDILAKKMYNRLGCNQLATERDAYDFAVARTVTPDDLAYAWGLMSTDMKTSTIDLCREHIQGGMPDHGAMHELAETRYGHIASNVWQHVVRMLESDLEYIPPLTQTEGDTGHRSGGHGR